MAFIAKVILTSILYGIDSKNTDVAEILFVSVINPWVKLEHKVNNIMYYYMCMIIINLAEDKRKEKNTCIFELFEQRDF